MLYILTAFFFVFHENIGLCRCIKRKCGLRKVTLSGWVVLIMPVTTPIVWVFFPLTLCLKFTGPVMFWLVFSDLRALWESAIKIYLCW